MFAMVLKQPRTPLVAEACEDPEPGPGELRLRVRACGVCRTDLHVVDGDLAQRRPTVVPGHEIVGVVDAIGPGVTGVRLGERRGVPWLGSTCGVCRYCREGQENLCDDPGFTGWTRDGGYADTVVARADFSFPLPDSLSDAEAAPLLCAGLIGFRSWRMACEGRPIRTLGLYGFGAAAHLLAQLAIHEGQAVHAFTREGDAPAQTLARDLGCVWTGGSDEAPPEPLDAAIIFAPVGGLVPPALAAVRKGGDRRLRRHPHERHPELSLRPALGRTAAGVGGQPDAPGRPRLPAPRRRRRGPPARDPLSAAVGERGARRPAGGPIHRRGGADALSRQAAFFGMGPT